MKTRGGSSGSQSDHASGFHCSETEGESLQIGYKSEPERRLIELTKPVGGFTFLGLVQWSGSSVGRAMD